MPESVKRKRSGEEPDERGHAGGDRHEGGGSCDPFAGAGGLFLDEGPAAVEKRLEDRVFFPGKGDRLLGALDEGPQALSERRQGLPFLDAEIAPAVLERPFLPRVREEEIRRLEACAREGAVDGKGPGRLSERRECGHEKEHPLDYSMPEGAIPAPLGKAVKVRDFLHPGADVVFTRPGELGQGVREAQKLSAGAEGRQALDHEAVLLDSAVELGPLADGVVEGLEDRPEAGPGEETCRLGLDRAFYLSVPILRDGSDR